MRQLAADGGPKRLTQVELHKAAAIVDEAGRDAAREADAVGGERAEGATRQLAQPPLQGRQRGDEGPCQPGVVVQVQVAQALGIRQGAEYVQSRALHTDPSDLPHCGNMPKILGPSEHLSPITYRSGIMRSRYADTLLKAGPPGGSGLLRWWRRG